MNRNVPSASQIQEAELAGCMWTNSIDYENNQCRTLIHWNSLTDRLGGVSQKMPIHQTCEIRRNGHRIL